ncbi:MAG: hypothetical protein ABWZ79_12055, partial [Pedobacter agri]
MVYLLGTIQCDKESLIFEITIQLDSMMFEYYDKTHPCAISLTTRFIGGKWKAVILMYLFSRRDITVSLIME